MRNSDVAKIVEILTDMDSKKDIDLAVKIIDIMNPDEPEAGWQPYRNGWWTTTGATNVHTDKIFLSNNSTVPDNDMIVKKGPGI